MMVSVIVPTYNRVDLLERCLTHLSQLEPPRNEWEVLVVDNGSTDNTKQVVSSFQTKITNLRYLFEPRPGLMMGRHRGCTEAKGDILCYLDDDSLVDRGWLRGIEQAFADPGVVLVGGPILPEYESAPPEWLDYYWAQIDEGKMLVQLSLIDLGTQEKKISPYYVFGCNFNIKKDVFIEVGGSHPDCLPKHLQKYQGDGETAVSRKLNERGHSAFYSPDVKIYHFVPRSRMTSEYFCGWYFYKGVCDSFTRLREEFGVEKIDVSKGEGQRSSKLKNYIKYLLLSGGRKVFRNLRKRPDVQNTEYLEVEAAAKGSYEAGKNFHRQAVENDPAMLAYVLRENFLGDNGEIPLIESEVS